MTDLSTTDELFFADTALSRDKAEAMTGDALSDADDGELFLEYRQSESIMFDDGRVKSASFDTAQGFGLRAVSGEATGYAHASELSEQALARAADTVRAVTHGHSGAAAVPLSQTNRALYGDDNPLSLVPFEDKVALLADMDAYARSLDDIALAGDVLMVKDPADLDMRGHPRGNLVDALSAPSDAPPRIAFVKGPMWADAEPYMDGLFAGVMEKLGDHAHEVEMTGVFDDALDCHATVMMANVRANIGDYCTEHADKVRAETVRRYEQGAGYSAEDYVKAIEFRDTIAAALDRMFDNYDVLITAAAPGEAPRDLSNTGNAVFQKIWTLTGVPTVTLPKLTGPSGLPVGVQVIGRFGHDGALLRHARWIEGAI